jgi:hypothetical protein
MPGSGTAVVAPDGELVDILRVQTLSPDEKAAIVARARCTKCPDPPPAAASWRRNSPSIRSPEQIVLVLASIVPDATAPEPRRDPQHARPHPLVRLTNWTVAPSCSTTRTSDHGFNTSIGSSMATTSPPAAPPRRQGGAHNHDANFLTFHRIEDFRPGRWRTHPIHRHAPS